MKEIKLLKIYKAVSCPPREELFPSDNRDELLCD